MRTIIDLPDSQIEGLERICRHEAISRAEAIRRAVAQMLELDRAGTSRDAFGLWRAAPVDGVKHQRRLRREWDAR